MHEAGHASLKIMFLIRHRHIAALAVSALLLASPFEAQAATKRGNKRSKPPLLEMPERPASGGRLRVATEFSGTSWDWNRDGHRIPGPILSAIHRGLYRADPGGRPVGDLVESENAAIDARMWTFRLRKGIRWNDGVEFTSKHVLSGWVRATEPSAQEPPEALRGVVGFAEFHSGAAAAIAGVTIPSDHVLEVRLSAPDPFFPQKLLDPRLMPARGDLIEKHRDYGFKVARMAFLGDWVVAISHAQLKSTLRRNPMADATTARDPETTLARDRTSEIELWHVTSDSMAQSLYQRNHLDLLLGVGIRGRGTDVLVHARPAMVTLGAHGSSGCDTACLQTLSVSIDRSKIEALAPAMGFIPPEIWRLQDYGSLLAESSRPTTNGSLPRTLVLAIRGDLAPRPSDIDLLQSVATNLRGQLRKRGCDLRLQFVPPGGTPPAGTLSLEIQEAPTPSIENLMLSIEGRELGKEWLRWAELPARSPERLQKFQQLAAGSLERARKIPVGFLRDYTQRKPWVLLEGELPTAHEPSLADFGLPDKNSAR